MVPSAPAGLSSSAQGGLWQHGHCSKRWRRQRLRRPGCSGGFRLRRGAPVVEEEEAEAMVHTVGRERARRQQGCGGGKLGPPAMVDAAALSATEGQSEKGRVRESAERAWRVPGFTKCEREQQRRVARRWDARQPWRACSVAWSTRRPSAEHLARVGVGEVGSRFGLATG